MGGKPLKSYKVVINLIANTTTDKEPTVRSELVKGKYENGKVIADYELLKIKLKRDNFHGKWNYAIDPNK